MPHPSHIKFFRRFSIRETWWRPFSYRRFLSRITYSLACTIEFSIVWGIRKKERRFQKRGKELVCRRDYQATAMFTDRLGTLWEDARKRKEETGRREKENCSKSQPMKPQNSVYTIIKLLTDRFRGREDSNYVEERFLSPVVLSKKTTILYDKCRHSNSYKSFLMWAQDFKQNVHSIWMKRHFTDMF